MSKTTNLARLRQAIRATAELAAAKADAQQQQRKGSTNMATKRKKLQAVAKGTKPTKRTKKAQPGTPVEAPKVRVLVYIPVDLADRAKAAVYHEGGGLSLSALCEAGLRRELARLEKRRGGPYPPADGPLVRGRRPKV